MTIEKALENFKSLFKSLLDAGYKLHELKAMTLDDVEFLIEITKQEEEKIVAIDKAFPGLF
ncbi:TPA: hypothetical protein ACGX6L_001126 [Listeria monocytogenes]